MRYLLISRSALWPHEGSSDIDTAVGISICASQQELLKHVACAGATYVSADDLPENGYELSRCGDLMRKLAGVATNAVLRDLYGSPNNTTEKFNPDIYAAREIGDAVDLAAMVRGSKR